MSNLKELLCKAKEQNLRASVFHEEARYCVEIYIEYNDGWALMLKCEYNYDYQPAEYMDGYTFMNEDVESYITDIYETLYWKDNDEEGIEYSEDEETLSLIGQLCGDKLDEVVFDYIKENR